MFREVYIFLFLSRDSGLICIQCNVFLPHVISNVQVLFAILLEFVVNTDQLTQQCRWISPLPQIRRCPIDGDHIDGDHIDDGSLFDL